VKAIDDWKQFLGDDFFKSITLKRVAAAEKFSESDITAIAARLTKFREIYDEAEEIPPLASWNINIASISDFAYTCQKLKKNCSLLKNTSQRWDNNEIQQYLQDEKYQKFVDATLERFIQQAMSLAPEKPDPISDEERDADADDDNQILADVLDKLDQTAANIEESVNCAEKKAEYANEQAENAQSVAKNAQSVADNILPNVLTTLGIFVAIIIAVVACYLSLLLSRHFNDAKPLNLALCLLMGHMLTNVICLLLYLISKMTSFTLACNCSVGNKKDCGQCPQEKRESCTWANKIWLKYPYAVLLNSIFCFSYVGLGIWKIIRTYLGHKMDKLLFESPPLVVATVLVVLLVVFAVTLHVIKFMKWTVPKSGHQSMSKAIDEAAWRTPRAVKELNKRIEAMEEEIKGLKEELNKAGKL